MGLGDFPHVTRIQKSYCNSNPGAMLLGLGFPQSLSCEVGHDANQRSRLFYLVVDRELTRLIV